MQIISHFSSSLSSLPLPRLSLSTALNFRRRTSKFPFYPSNHIEIPRLPLLACNLSSGRSQQQAPMDSPPPQAAASVDSVTHDFQNQSLASDGGDGKICKNESNGVSNTQRVRLKLEDLNWDNSFARELPGDPRTDTIPREVLHACYTKVSPSAEVENPQLVAWSESVAEFLDLDPKEFERPDFPLLFSGASPLVGSLPYAQCYGGHQFGMWAGQLGDGRAITLGEVLNSKSEKWELQLKGAGKTPYSRFADGLAVLRSSIREFLCSEAMHNLGIPTTRALCLVTTGKFVTRDMFYDGNPKEEPGAIVCRVSPSFLRFGSYQIHASREKEDLEIVRALADYAIRHHFPHIENMSRSESLSFNTGNEEVLDLTSNKYAGRVINAMAKPIDGQGEISSSESRLIESPAPGIISRRSVYEPLQTGLIAIDSMIPIGRGQRELIIGDRQTGKTVVATDTILNQQGQKCNMHLCSYWSKASSVAQVVTALQERGAMEYTVVVAETADLSAKYVSARFMPNVVTTIVLNLAWAVEVAERTASLVARWQGVGFTHGVLNTDNMSILGLTIDYGPFGFLDAFDPSYTPNTTDLPGRRYCFANQPDIGLWNIAQFTRTLVAAKLIDDKEANYAMERYGTKFMDDYQAIMTKKLGLPKYIKQLISKLLNNMAIDKVDYTNFFRLLSNIKADPNIPTEELLNPLKAVLLDIGQERKEAWISWVKIYIEELASSGISDEERKASMNAVNPKYVLRNYLCQSAIDAAEQGDFEEVRRVLKVMERPYDEQPGMEKYARLPPAWAYRPGVCMLSCSS